MFLNKRYENKQFCQNNFAKRTCFLISHVATKQVILTLKFNVNGGLQVQLVKDGAGSTGQNWTPVFGRRTDPVLRSACS